MRASERYTVTVMSMFRSLFISRVLNGRVRGGLHLGTRSRGSGSGSATAEQPVLFYCTVLRNARQYAGKRCILRRLLY